MDLEDPPVPDDPPLTRTVQYVVLDFGGGMGDDPVVIGPWPTEAEATAWAYCYDIDPLDRYTPKPVVSWGGRTVIPLWHPVHYCEQTGM